MKLFKDSVMIFIITGYFLLFKFYVNFSNHDGLDKDKLVPRHRKIIFTLDRKRNLIEYCEWSLYAGISN